MKPTILIFSRSIRSGKTTELMHAFSGKTTVGGFLSPDVAGLRMLYDVSTGTYHPFEAAEKSLAPVQSIGKFRFLESGFEKAKSLFREEKALLVIDEVGKLEVIAHKGLEPALSVLIADCISGKRNDTLLLVIRETLLAAAIQKYGLANAPVFSSLEPIKGLLR